MPPSQNNLKICGSTCVSQLRSSANRYNTNIQFKNIQCFLIFYVISFNGLIFGAGIFGGLICSPFDYPCHLKSGVPPWAHDLNISCLASDSDTNVFMVVSWLWLQFWLLQICRRCFQFLRTSENQENKGKPLLSGHPPIPTSGRLMEVGHSIEVYHELA